MKLASRVRSPDRELDARVDQYTSRIDFARWLLLAATPDSESGGRWFDSNSRNFCTEGIRPDEETVLKTVAVNRRCGFESHIFRLN